MKKSYFVTVILARAEFAEKKGNATRVSEVPRTQQNNASARIYHPDGTPANDASRGILIQNNQKFVRK